MVRVRLTVTRVVDHAVSMADDRGFEAISLSSVASGLGVATSALYNHCEGLDGLHRQIAEASAANLLDAIRTAAIGVAGDDALTAMAVAYRRFAIDHPGQFAAILRPALRGEAVAVHERDVVDLFALVLRTLDVEEPISAAHAVHAALHGFVALEFGSRAAVPSAPDADARFERLLRTLRDGLGIRPAVSS